MSGFAYALHVEGIRSIPQNKTQECQGVAPQTPFTNTDELTCESSRQLARLKFGKGLKPDVEQLAMLILYVFLSIGLFTFFWYRTLGSWAGLASRWKAVAVMRSDWV